jgi:hypothetical protein
MPGVLRMLELAHKDYGRTAWPQLFNSGIDLASKGFPISGRMAAALDGSKVELARDADAAKLYFDARASRWRWAPSSSTSPMPTRCAASPAAVPMPSTAATWPRPSSARWA